MKKYIISILILALVFIASCSKKDAEKRAKIKELEKTGAAVLLPDSTEFMLKLSSFEDMSTYLPITETSTFDQPIENLEEIEETLGFNPFNLDELKVQGVDTGKEVGLLFSDFILEDNNENPDVNVLVFIPVTDGQKVIETLKTIVQKKSPTVSFTREDDLTIVEVADNNVKGYLALKDSYLFMAINPKTDARPFIRSVLDGKTSLAKLPTYTEVASRIGSGEEIFMYANIKKAVEKNLETIKTLSKNSLAKPNAPDVSKSIDYLSDYEGVGFSLDLESSDFVLKTFGSVVPGSASSKVLKGVKFDKDIVLGLREYPVLLITAGVNFAEYYNMFVEALSDNDAGDIKSRQEEIKETFGIDIEKDIIENLAGSVNWGIYDAGSITMMNYNTLLTLNVKDGKAMKRLIETVIDRLPPRQRSTIRKETIGDVEAYTMMAGFVQAYVGVHEKNLIVAVGKPMFEKALSGEVSSGFTNNMQDKELVAKLKGDTSLLYLSFDELMKLYQNFGVLLQGFTGGKGFNAEKQEALNKFEYILGSSKFEDNAILGEFIIKTKFTEPFFIETGKLMKSFE